ncbi:DUF6225 family protein [Streptomyces atratus]|uniref:DUF6225 family protein n=1 Tax=Streptomyces atratus TaxID=1893 RepID=UPI003570CFE2
MWNAAQLREAIKDLPDDTPIHIVSPKTPVVPTGTDQAPDARPILDHPAQSPHPPPAAVITKERPQPLSWRVERLRSWPWSGVASI